MAIEKEELNKRFPLDGPSTNIAGGGRGLARLIEDECPDSREKSLALTKLEEVMMWAEKSLK